MLKLLETLESCLAGKHDLVEILEVNAGFDTTHVVRWCRDCGSVVVDVDHDNRTQPGYVMQMRSPESIKTFIARLNRDLLHSLVSGLVIELACRLLGPNKDHAALWAMAEGKAPVPDEIAARVRFLAAVIGYLEGAYNNEGVNDWFERKRTQLDGKSPAEILAGDWDPKSKDAQKVLELARSLSSSPAT